MKKVQIEMYDCNFEFGGYIFVECDTFERVDDYEVKINGAKTSFGHKIKSIEVNPMVEHTFDFEITGTLYTGDKAIDTQILSNAFADFAESKGWGFSGKTGVPKEE